jgi:hypothetical protein
MKINVMITFSVLTVLSCDLKDRPDPSHEDLFQLYTTNCARVVAYEKAFCLEDIDYDAFYNPDVLIIGTSFNSLDTVGLDANKNTHRKLWDAYKFSFNEPIRFMPGLDPITNRMDGSVHMYIELLVQLDTGGDVVMIPIYEEYDFDSAGRIIRLLYYGDMTAAFDALNHIEN